MTRSYFATAECLHAPSATADYPSAEERALHRARFYGVGEVWCIGTDGLVLLKRFVRAVGEHLIETTDVT